MSNISSKQPTTTPSFLTRKEAAQFLKLTPGSLSNLHGQRKGPTFYKKGKLVYYLESDLIRWILDGRQEVK